MGRKLSGTYPRVIYGTYNLPTKIEDIYYRGIRIIDVPKAPGGSLKVVEVGRNNVGLYTQYTIYGEKDLDNFITQRILSEIKDPVLKKYVLSIVKDLPHGSTTHGT